MMVRHATATVQYMARLILMLIVILLTTLALGVQAQEKKRPDPVPSSGLFKLRSSSELSSEAYSNVLMQVIPAVSKNYQFQDISENALAGRALLSLYRAGKLTAPEALVRDTDRYFDTQAGKDLLEKLKNAREAAGDSSLIRGDRGIHASLNGLFQTLDQFSNYAEADYQTRQIFETGAGIGLFLEDKPLGGSYFVRNVEINGPAHKQGIRPGDELLEIDHKSIAANTPTGVVNMQMTFSARRRSGLSLTLRSLQGTKKSVEVSSLRHDAENSELVALSPEFNRETPVLGFRYLGDDNWDFWVDRPNRIAIIRLGTIQSGIGKVYDIVNQLLDDGLKGLILDLRDCPSGVPDQSAEVAGYFLEQNALIATMRYRNAANDDTNRGQATRELRARPIESKRCQDVPLAVLIGPDTSGAAEMIAAALQDHERAKIIGQRSRGKSTIQQVKIPQDERYRIFFSYRLTVGIFKRPSGKDLLRLPGSTARDDWGVRPDIEVVIPSQLRRQVRAWWFDHDTRPVDSLEASKLDDAKNDPVLNAALQLLRK